MTPGTDVVNEIVELWERLQAKIEDLRRAIDDILGKIPGFLEGIVERIKQGWNELVVKFRQLSVKVAYYLSLTGSPGALSSTGDAWATSVGGPVSNEVTDVDAGLLLVDDTWVGDAATQYKQHIPLQKSALQAVKATYTDAIGNALDKVQLGLFAWYASMLVAIAAFTIATIQAIVAAVSVAGAPAAPFIAIGGCIAFYAALAAGALILHSQAASANSALVAKLHDDTAYPHGSWPKGTA